MAKESSLELVPTGAIPDPHMFRLDRREHWGRIADLVEMEPEVLAVPLDNIRRWLARGRLRPEPLEEWLQRIEAGVASPDGLASLLAYLRDDNEDAELLKSCSPFVGLPGLARR